MENHSASTVEALSAIRDGREQAAQYVGSPWWYYPIFGVGFALVGLAYSVGSSPIGSLTLVAFIVAGKLMQRGYRRAKGVWVGGLRSGNATWWTVGFLLVSFGTFIAGIQVSESMGQSWPAWIMAALILLETLLYGFFFERALRRKLRPTLS